MGHRSIRPRSHSWRRWAAKLRDTLARAGDPDADELNRVDRGGSWDNPAQNARVANRNDNTPGNRNRNLGSRLARASRSQTSPGSGSATRAGEGPAFVPWSPA